MVQMGGCRNSEPEAIMDLEQRVVELERRTTRYRNAMVLLVVGN